MLKKWQKATACLMSITLAMGMLGCENTPAYSAPSEPIEEVDELRTQLYLYNTDFVGGSAWLQRLADEFEKLHADDTYWEEGKTGVQVIVHTSTDRTEDLTARLKAGVEEVYFSQTPSYRSLAGQGLLMDLTEMVSTPLQGETRSVTDKMSATQKEYYALKSGDSATAQPTTATVCTGATISRASTANSQANLDENCTYYGIPYRMGTFGFVYNVDMFEKHGYYFSAEPTSELDPFVKTATEKRSAGGDGVFGTADDGLPATYTQFFALCDKISSNGHVPLTWGGATYGEYLTWLTNALATDSDGYEQTMLRYTLDGVADGLGDIKNGGFWKDEQPLTITEENGYELTRSSGVFRALEFVRKLTTTKTYYDGEAFRSDRTQAEAQADFMAGETLNVGMKKPIAMLADGSWWQSGLTANADAEPTTPSPAEASSDDTEETEPRFAFMPLPKATKAQIGEDSTLFSCLSSSVFVSSRVADWKQPLVQDFIEFITSDASLKNYMLWTNSQTALDVTLTETEKEGLSYFGKTAFDIQLNADMVAPYSINPLVLNNENYFSIQEFWGATFALASRMEYPAEAFRKHNVSVVDYFKGMYKNRSESWSALKQV